MIKQEIIEKISKYFKLTEYEAEKVYDDIFSIIVTGVKEDNIVDVANFGEFIIKYNNGKTNGNGNGNGNGYRKTIEFLASTGFEEELNESRFEEPVQNSQEDTTPVVPPAHDIIESSSVEEELRKKREEILSKITGPILPRPSILSSETKKEETIYTPEPEKTEEQIPAEESITNDAKAEENIEVTAIEDMPVEPESIIDEVPAIEEIGKEKAVEEGVEDMSHRSFSDYFSEVTEDTKPVTEQKPLEEPKEEVIPKSAVLLHNEIMGTESKERILPEEPPKQQIQPVADTEIEPERRADDNSYYIWYKDSESNPTDTQTLSYEYELLYQATKEAEYKSKLKIYVTTFIIFFSIVRLLLIFSPVIYKVFFSPEEIQNIENIQEEPPGVSEQKAVPNVIEDNLTGQEQQTQVLPPSDTNAQNQTQVAQEQNTQTEQTPPVKQEETKTQEQQNQTQPPPQVDKKLDGVSKNAAGWQDVKYNVLYIQLENGKYTIQESAWDSDAKANKRISAVESLGISGLKGNVVKADLGAKGTWYRVRFGEFSTLEEARGKAAELRKK